MQEERQPGSTFSGNQKWKSFWKSYSGTTSFTASPATGENAIISSERPKEDGKLSTKKKISGDIFHQHSREIQPAVSVRHQSWTLELETKTESQKIQLLDQLTRHPTFTVKYSKARRR